MTQNLYQVESRWVRIKRWLFPPQPLHFEQPAWAEQNIKLTSWVKFSLLERIRILFTGRVKIRAAIACQHSPGYVATELVCYPCATNDER